MDFDPLYRDTIDILRWMVAEDTTTSESTYHSSLPLLRKIEAQLSDVGIASVTIPTSYGGSAALFARLGGPAVPGGIVLSGHIDVVPSEDPKKWTSPPFEMTERNGLIYGRGVADMKGFDSAVVAMAGEYQRMNLKTPIYALFTPDEEINCKAMPDVVDFFEKIEFNPSRMILGEPTGNIPRDRHNGRALIDIHAECTGGHSSQRLHLEFKPKGNTNAMEATVLIAAHMIANNHAIRDALGSDDLGPAAFSLTSSESGIASNVLRPSHVLGFDLRGRPGLTEAEIRNALSFSMEQGLVQSIAADNRPNKLPELRIRVTSQGFRCDDPTTGELIRRFAEAESVIPVEFNTEANVLFSRGWGGKVGVIGPGLPGQAHMIDEYLEPEKLNDCLFMLRRIGQAALQPNAFN